MTNHAQGPSKNERRAHARELARKTREAELKRKRRARWILQGSISVAVLVVVGIVLAVVLSSGGGSASQSSSAAGPLNMLSDGVVLTGSGGTVTAVTTPALQPKAQPVATDNSASSAKSHIVVYLDYECPYCDQFETANSAQMKSWVEAGTATLEIHPISILDNSSAGTNYSTRSANAAACVANFDPNSFLDVNAALFANQPAEGAVGLTDAQITSILSKAGVTGTKVSSCIAKQTFSKWVAAETARALAGPLPDSNVSKVTGTPTVIVNGKSYTGALNDPAAFKAFVEG
jgi:protein-disulfide isomerase